MRPSGGSLRLDDDMRRVVREQSLGFVATVCPDGTPNLSPKGTTVVWGDEHLAQNPAIEINVVDPVTRRRDHHLDLAAGHLRES
jgi:hypothetical protein